MGGAMEGLYVETIAKVGSRHICLFLLEPQQDFLLVEYKALERQRECLF
jgi:hypothetical protein